MAAATATAPPDTAAVSGPAPTSIPSTSLASASSSSSTTTAAAAAAARTTQPLDSASSTAVVTPQPEAPEAETSESQSAAAAAEAFAPGDVNGLLPDVIDSDIFAQLLEMDDDDEEDREFSKGIVWNYFDQASTTFDHMDHALANEDLNELSTLGHFLKGSSAAVGVNKVRDSCEAMQHYGKQHDEDGIRVISRQDAIDRLKKTLKAVKLQYKEAEIVLKRFYGDV
ncbi:Phosphorelay intermediate protein [Tilletia horrida]|uniref:Phosphorelay intermediate protein n=1 Tax=Tilletia horrida TaxID=155126 RepID=A0AAN6GKW4_9BASI|nr:Phosphorelay intermediate protein [Tilletia horrida]KAK0549924.1 Phosphorelay intermediate protein [Tilletia horrida]